MTPHLVYCSYDLAVESSYVIKVEEAFRIWVGSVLHPERNN